MAVAVPWLYLAEDAKKVVKPEVLDDQKGATTRLYDEKPVSELEVK